VNRPDRDALRRLEVETRGHHLLSGDETDLILAQLPAILAALERAERVEAAARVVAADDALDNGDELVRRLFRLRAALVSAPIEEADRG
jgi:hypothetical protein